MKIIFTKIFLLISIALVLFCCAIGPTLPSSEKNTQQEASFGKDAQAEPSFETDEQQPLAQIQNLPCDQVEKEWRKFVDAHNGCQKTEDCVIAGMPRENFKVCDCNVTLGVTAVSTSASKMAEAYMDRYSSQACESVQRKRCDAQRPTNLRCDGGKCVVDNPFCSHSGESLFGDGGTTDY